MEGFSKIEHHWLKHHLLFLAQTASFSFIAHHTSCHILQLFMHFQSGSEQELAVWSNARSPHLKQCWDAGPHKAWALGYSDVSQVIQMCNQDGEF